jgi:hypothetical protein
MSGPRCSWRLAIALGCLCLAPNVAAAQTTPAAPPPTQDQQVRQLLGLGASSGCFALLGVNDDTASVTTELERLGVLIGNGLRAICGPSAVNSASSLGGGLNSLQATKTVTQSNLARRRIERRRAAARRKPSRDGWTTRFQPSASLTLGDPAPTGGGLFGELQLDRRDRVDTDYEHGYTSNIAGIAGGADYAGIRGVVGGWFGRTQQTADFQRFSALIGGFADDSFAEVLSNRTVLRAVCGGISDAGSFTQRSTRFGGFGAWSVGGRGFMDAAFVWSRHDQEYDRNVCAIEAAGAIEFVGGELRSDIGEEIDDIFAGTVTGEFAVREISASLRAGVDLGDAVVFSPRVAVTLTRAATNAYTEAGRSTVANTVVSNEDVAVTRRLGDPIGLELAFEPQSRLSILIEAGAEISGRAGPIVPHAAGYWRRELRDDFPIVSARFAQDLRPDPTIFDFGLDAHDTNAFLFSVGVSAFAGDRVSARVDLSTLAADALFSSRLISAQVRVRF